MHPTNDVRERLGCGNGERADGTRQTREGLLGGNGWMVNGSLDEDELSPHSMLLLQLPSVKKDGGEKERKDAAHTFSTGWGSDLAVPSPDTQTGHSMRRTRKRRRLVGGWDSRASLSQSSLFAASLRALRTYGSDPGCRFRCRYRLPRGPPIVVDGALPPQRDSLLDRREER